MRVLKVPRVLLIDTCGEPGSLALAEGETVVERRVLAPREASAKLLPAIEDMLQAMGWALAELDGIGVVSGPGSFTGVRVGLAAAKGLCLATGVGLAAVSRLEVLAETAGALEGCAVLDAGRGEFYARVLQEDKAEGGEARELLCDAEGLCALARGKRVVFAEPKLRARLAEFDAALWDLSAESALPAVLRCLRAGGSDVALADANYVRGEKDIYAKPGATKPGGNAMPGNTKSDGSTGEGVCA